MATKMEKHDVGGTKMLDFQRHTPDMTISHREHRLSDSESTVPPSSAASPYKETGAPINRSATAELRKGQNSGLAWPRIRRTCREAFSEFMGVFVLIMFGDGVVAQVVLSDNTKGDYQSISWGWGIGVMLGVYASGISGGHINPAVTFANCIFRGQYGWLKRLRSNISD